MFALALSKLLKNFPGLKAPTQLEGKLVDTEYNLEEYLKDEEAIQCYKDMGANTKKYFNKDKIKQLIKYITIEPEEDDHLKGHKFPYVASEMLKNSSDEIMDLFVMTNEEYNNKYKKVNQEKSEVETTSDETIDNLANSPIEVAPLKEEKNNDNNTKSESDLVEDKKEDKNVESKEKEQKEDKKDEKEITENKQNNNSEKSEESKVKDEKNEEKDKEKEKVNSEEKKIEEAQKENKNDIQKQENNQSSDNSKENNEEKDIKDKDKDKNIEEKKENEKETNNELEKKEEKEDQKEEKEKVNENINNITLPHNELLDLLLDFAISDKPILNDVLCGYFSDVLKILIDKYPSKILFYMYIIRQDVLKKIALHSYQTSLSVVFSKVLKLENLLSSMLNDVKKEPSKYDIASLVKQLQTCNTFRNELIGLLINSLNLEGIKDEKGNIIEDADVESIFSGLNDLLMAKDILEYITTNKLIYNHIFEILGAKVFTKEEDNKNKQRMYKLFIIFLTKLFAGINAQKGNDIDLLKDFDPKYAEKPSNSFSFFEQFLYTFSNSIINNYNDNLSINKECGLGIHNIYILDLVIEIFQILKKNPILFDDILIKTKFMQKSINYFFKHQLNNIYQLKFVKLMKLYLEFISDCNMITDHLFNEIKLHEIFANYIFQEGPDKDNNNEENKSNEIFNDNKYHYKSGKTILSCSYPHIVGLMYKMQTIGGLDTFDENKKKDLKIINLGEFEFVKDETSSKDVIQIKTSEKLNEILKSSKIWMDAFEKTIKPLIEKYESILCSSVYVKTEKVIPKIGIENNLIKTLKELEKILNKAEPITNKKYNDVNYWETKPSISQELKDKIKNNQENPTTTEDKNKKEENNENEENKNNEIDEEDELLGIAMKLEQNEKAQNVKKISNPTPNSIKIASNINFQLVRPNSFAKMLIKSKVNKESINKINEEKNSKYNDNNYWKSNTESLIDKKEIDSLLDDL